jgi:cytochrome c oxidase cbb3-type subunit III
MSAIDPHAHDRPEIDAATGRMTTGHSWDGIKELNTPLPRWWLWLFYACILWAVAYWVVYPAWPLVSNYTKGVLGYSSRAELAKDMEALKAARDAQAGGLAAAELAAIKADPQMLAVAMARGKAAFGDNCAACHGSGGQGASGYPSLADDDWLWGGTLDEIHATIQHGIRSKADSETRDMGAMPSFGRDGLLDAAQITNVASYVRTLSGLAPAEGADVAAGGAIFAEQCVSCHGDKGQGDKSFGAPALSDKIWLYGGEVEAIRQTLYLGRGGVMPNWAGRLDPATTKSLAIYVHSLGGGQ